MVLEVSSAEGWGLFFADCDEGTITGELVREHEVGASLSIHTVGLRGAAVVVTEGDEDGVFFGELIEAGGGWR